MKMIVRSHSIIVSGRTSNFATPSSNSLLHNLWLRCIFFIFLRLNFNFDLSNFTAFLRPWLFFKCLYDEVFLPNLEHSHELRVGVGYSLAAFRLLSDLFFDFEARIFSLEEGNSRA
jgi:hypothetical protein